MNFKKTTQKILGNKMFMYAMIILTLGHAFSYLINRRYDVLSFLILSAIIIYQFNKNTSFILLISLILTHFFMAGRYVYEGLENNTDTSDTSETIEKIKDNDKEMGKAADIIKNPDVDVNKAKEIIKENKENKEDTKNKEKISEIKDQNNTDLNSGTASESDPTPESFEGGKKGTIRLDHAATLEDAYDNIQSVLGSDGINKLTQDTQKLMKQQQQLFNTMNSLTPAVTETMKMLEGMDLKQFSNLGGNLSKVTSDLKGFLNKKEPTASNEKKK